MREKEKKQEEKEETILLILLTGFHNNVVGREEGRREMRGGRVEERGKSKERNMSVYEKGIGQV